MLTNLERKPQYRMHALHDDYHDVGLGACLRCAGTIETFD